MDQFEQLLTAAKLPTEGRLFAEQVRGRGALHHLAEATKRIKIGGLDAAIQEVMVLAKQKA